MTCGKLEMDILNSFWNLTEEDEDRDISIQDVVDYLENSGVSRAYTTIKTVMDRLTTKSVLVRYKVGKKFFYKVTMDRKEMALESVKELAADFFDGSCVRMLHFIEQECCEKVL